MEKINFGFWKKLKRPFFALAPMANVTDAAFRAMFLKYGRPDVFWTEFVAADGLASEKGRPKLLVDLIFQKKERPIVAQFFGSRPMNILRAAALARELGFDGVDINMGCPVRAIERQGAGAVLMKSPALAKEIIAAAKEGAGRLPVSVKTRIGYAKDELEVWLPVVLEAGVAAVTIHARTMKEMSKVPARWETLARAVAIRNGICPKNARTLIVGNGDVFSLADGKEKARIYGVDGVMVGRGVFGDPWFFSGKKSSPQQRIKALIEHTKLFHKLYGREKRFDLMKKHYKAYLREFDGAKDLRMALMAAKSAEEAIRTAEKNLL
jgi:nifR3 family TIM-barrel protein